MNIMDTLITDRTQADVDARNAKGTYNASDLNRVTAAMDELKTQMNKRGYEVPNYVLVKEGLWTNEDIPTASQMGKYISNVMAIRYTIDVLHTTPETPADMEFLTWVEANDIEKILSDVETVLTYLNNYWFQRVAGTFYAGNYDRLQWFSRGR